MKTETAYLAPPGGVSEFSERYHYINFTNRNVRVGIKVFDSQGNEVKQLKDTTVPPMSGTSGEISWNGTYQSGTTAPNGFYTVKTSDRVLKVAELEVECSGFYAHMPKILDNEGKMHIRERHYGFQFENATLKELIRQYSQGVIGLGRLERGIQAIGDGQGRIYPKRFDDLDIYSMVTSIGNLQQTGDRCARSTDGTGLINWHVNGNRNGINIDVYVEIPPNANPSARIVSGYSKENGVPVKKFYSDPDVLARWELNP